MKIYAVVGIGAHEDEGAIGVFADKQRAEKYCKAENELNKLFYGYTYNPYSVKEWYLDEGNENDETEVE